jgi:hypothetical protein
MWASLLPDCLPHSSSLIFPHSLSYRLSQTALLTLSFPHHRRKDLKNPRKKNRVKFAKALVRRSGAVQEGGRNRDSGLAAYGGEATGIKARVAKSRKL